jgi:uncharacterized protein involved in type VI secretion and phage assembly
LNILLAWKYSDIKGHLKENHLEECCEYVESDFKFLYRLTKYMKIFCFIFAYNEVFFPSFQGEDDTFMLFFCMSVLLEMQLNINTKWSSLINMIQKALQLCI